MKMLNGSVHRARFLIRHQRRTVTFVDCRDTDEANLYVMYSFSFHTIYVFLFAYFPVTFTFNMLLKKCIMLLIHV
jgi:hypothetical protein